MLLVVFAILLMRSYLCEVTYAKSLTQSYLRKLVTQTVPDTRRNLQPRGLLWE